MESWKVLLFAAGLGASSFTAPAQTQPSPAPAAPTPGSDAKTWVDYGVSDGDVNGAIQAFEQAIKIDPKYAPAYYNLGRAYAFQNKAASAISSYTQAVQIDPNFADAYYLRGTLYGQQGDLDNALSDFTQVTKINPKFGPAYYNQGHVQYFKGNLDAALDDINQALQIDPQFPFSYYIRGLVHRAQGHGELAVADFQKSAGLNFPEAVYWVWITETEAGQAMQARKDLLDALSRPQTFKPDDWTTQIGNFLLEKITRNQMMAQAKSDNAEEARVMLCQAWFYAGMQALLTGDTKDARECFTQAVGTGSKGSEEYIEANRELTTMATP